MCYIRVVWCPFHPMDTGTSSLREKFKLLRQWQMQQQEEFERIKMEHSANSSHYGGLVSDALMKPIQISDDKTEVEDVKDTESDGRHGNRDGITAESGPLVEQDFLKRMSSNSLEQALSLAVDELKSQHDLISDSAGNNLEGGGEFSDSEDNDRNYFENSWNRSMKLQTAIFRGHLQSSENNELSSDVESELDEIIDMDGFYPIIYSEDNGSQGEPIRTDTDDEAFGNGRVDNRIMQKDALSFDEKPIQSKIGQDVMSFEDLIEKQLEAERKSNTSLSKPGDNLLSKKKFLRKGEGIARFTGGSKTDQGSKVGYMKTNKANFLPERSLKLKAEMPLKDRKFTEISTSNAEKVSDGLNPKRDVRTSREMAAESSTRKDFPTTQPLPRSSVGFQKHSVVTRVDSSIEMSFQKMLEGKNIDEKIADEELAEFELLEKEALDTSMSSNASSVFSLISANKSSNVNLNTSSPIQKAVAVDRGMMPGNAGNQILGVSNASVITVEELADNERSSKSEPGGSSSVDRVQMIDRSASAMKCEGVAIKEDEFSDDSQWDDTIRSSDAMDDGNSTIVASPQLKTAPDANHLQSVTASPPTSQLMKKFFPKLDTKEKRSERSENSTKKMEHGKQNLSNSKKDNLKQSIGKENVPPSRQSGILKSKLAELESEISRFKKENAALESLRVEKEKELINLKNEVQQFEKKRAEELEQIEKFRDEEMQKLRREKKTFEKYQKAMRSAPNKKEREEMEALKQEVIHFQDEIKRRETRWNGSASRFRKRIEDLENENFELKESIKLLEKDRLQKWGKTDNKTLEVKERNVNILPAEDVKQVANGIMTRSDLEQCVDHGLERNPGTRKMKPNSRKSISPRDEIRKPRIVLKGEVNPRKGIAPYEQPEIPREPRTEDSSTAGSTETVSVRLSLTPERKHSSVEKSLQGNTHLKHQDGKVERILPDGSREITFPNGTRKIVDPTGQHIVVSFFNGDIKQIFPDDRTIYFYAESKTTHTTYSDGTEVFEFSNGQSEKHYPDGRKVITFHDQTVKCIFGNGAEETVFADGTIQNIDTNGQRTISFPNGQREIHTKHFKRREYPDGTVKTVYQDGRQETRYSTGRIRIKDQFGNVTLDTGLS